MIGRSYIYTENFYEICNSTIVPDSVILFYGPGRNCDQR